MDILVKKPAVKPRILMVTSKASPTPIVLPKVGKVIIDETILFLSGISPIGIPLQNGPLPGVRP